MASFDGTTRGHMHDLHGAGCRPECAEHTAISVAIRGGFAERVDDRPNRPRACETRVTGSAPQISPIEFDIVISQNAGVLLFECPLGVVLFLISDVFPNLFDRRLAHREGSISTLPGELGVVLLCPA